MINKSSMTTVLSILLIAIGHFSPVYSKLMTTMGLFATSGAVTNWLAIHMLFEKIPFLYGSGIIPLKFNEFKQGIKEMMMTQFFNEENIQKFIAEGMTSQNNLDLKKMTGLIDHDHFFNKLIETVNESQLGGMLTMFGGTTALEPLRTPFASKMEQALLENIERPEFIEGIKNVFSQENGEEKLNEKIEKIVLNRLNELTPNIVKDIIQDMIRSHMGWLVIWGGIFGALLGALSTLLL